MEQNGVTEPCCTD